ncbi:MAG: BMP family ABC transporter substrate-binding protein [Oscillospiraceae bacterium]|nr:BMP family ABC transporter substrate-binding protein [Oscillospiraceae bacterium]
MNRTEALDEYGRALRAGQREYKELLSAKQEPYPAVLDDILTDIATEATQNVGLVEIPADQIVGTKSAGRISAFTASFLPLLDAESEFANKWIALCMAHMSDEGIRDPIVCYEYLGNFYVQEGNKRVSVLRHFGAARIPATVTRVLPKADGSPRIKAYYEFLDFYKASGIYNVQFHRPGDYSKLLSAMGKEPGEGWTERERLSFTAYFQYFRDAFDALNGQLLSIRPEDALLLWLTVYPYRDLGRLSTEELKKSLNAIWENLTALSQPEPVKVETETPKAKGGILGRIITAGPEHLNVAFIHQLSAERSGWSKAHDEGREYLEAVMGDAVTTRSYFGADTPEQVEAALEQAIADGAQVVFTTTPQMGRPTLKAAVKHPKVRFLNCAVDIPYSSIRTYYGRLYEGKFITGAIAGAMANNDRIGYIAAYPIFGEPASINAFALGAQMTNPRAKIDLRWSCQSGRPVSDFVSDGIRVISNRELPSQAQICMDFCNFGTYQVEEDGVLTPLGSPCWMWGKFYETVIRSIMSGAWETGKDDLRAVNYWWGMDTGVIDVKLSDKLPDGVRTLAEMLRNGLQNGTIDPFLRTITAQDGSVKNDGSRKFTPDEILHMDWLCENVEGSIPRFDEILPISQPMVRALGVYRDEIPAEKEAPL